MTIQSPRDVQAVISHLQYVQDGTPEEPLVRSAVRTLRERRGRCIEGTMAAAYLMEQLSHQPIVLQMLAENGEDDHAVYLYHDGGLRTIGHSSIEVLQSLPGTYEDPAAVVNEYARRAKTFDIFVKGWGLIDLTGMKGWRSSEKNLASHYLEHSRKFPFEKL